MLRAPCAGSPDAEEQNAVIGKQRGEALQSLLQTVGIRRLRLIAAGEMQQRSEHAGDEIERPGEGKLLGTKIEMLDADPPVRGAGVRNVAACEANGIAIVVDAEDLTILGHGATKADRITRGARADVENPAQAAPQCATL